METNKLKEIRRTKITNMEFFMQKVLISLESPLLFCKLITIRNQLSCVIKFVT